MSWLRNTSLSIARQLSKTLDPRHDYEPQACFSSFCKHWQQAHDIIQKSQPQHLHDDVLGVINHLEQLSTLLVLEAKAREIQTSSSPESCLEYLLSENLLDKLYEWAILTGKYENAVRLEQLKLYGNLVSHYNSEVIAAEPFLRPLLKLLSGFRNELPPHNVETQLVTVLNQLCVALVQNIKFIDLFFLTTHTRNGSQAEFIIVRLLLASVHREGRTGSTARDALLLCAKMSALSPQLAEYMLKTSNTCPVLATGLSGLYSLLPRTLSDKIYKLMPDDVNQVHKLMLFIDSLEFCNAVAQVAHPSIKSHLLDLLYQGFLVPVMGPALLQSGVPEQIAAIAYLELIVRCTTPEGLLKTVLGFLLQYEYDDVKIIDVMLSRLNGDTQLSLVSLSLMETLIDLNSEDVMLELVFKYLISGHYLNPHAKSKINEANTYRDASLSLLRLSPICCSRPLDKTREWTESMTLNGRRVLELKSCEEGRRTVNGNMDGIAMENLVEEIKYNYGNPNETLLGNFHAYLCDARFEIVSRTVATLNWSSKYDTIIPTKREPNNNASKETKDIDIANVCTKEPDSLISICTSGYETLKTSDTSDKEPHSLTSLVEDLIDREHDSITSFGESSGYDSFRYKLDEGDEERPSEETFLRSLGKIEMGHSSHVHKSYEEALFVNSKFSAESIIGPLLHNLLKKVTSFLTSDVVQNVRLTSVITKLCTLPTPLLSALLLCPAVVNHSLLPSLYQILLELKEELDNLTSHLENSEQLVDQARVFLIQREMTLVKTRNATTTDDNNSQPSEHYRRLEDTPPARPVEPKRRTLSNSFSFMFARRPSYSSPTNPSSSTPIAHRNDKGPNFTQEEYWNQSLSLRAVLNAVLLDEWLKELSAIAIEHSLRLAAYKNEDDSYVRSIAL